MLRGTSIDIGSRSWEEKLDYLKKEKSKTVLSRMSRSTAKTQILRQESKHSKKVEAQSIQALVADSELCWRLCESRCPASLDKRLRPTDAA